MRSAAFHVEWPVLMQTQSLGIQMRSSLVMEVRRTSEKMRRGEGWRRDEERGREEMIERL